MLKLASGGLEGVIGHFLPFLRNWEVPELERVSEWSGQFSVSVHLNSLYSFPTKIL